jgi:diamine N-acetyltransferase
MDDHESLCQIYTQLDESHRLSHPELFIKPAEYARAKEYISEIILDPTKALFVAEVDLEVVGLAECFIQQTSHFPVIKKREWVQLDNIAIKKEYQNKNVGSSLLEKVIEWAQSKGLDRVELKVYSFNRNAVEFYSGKGFKDLNKTMYLNL